VQTHYRNIDIPFIDFQYSGMDDLELISVDQYKVEMVFEKHFLMLLYIVELHVEFRVFDSRDGKYRINCSYPIHIRNGLPSLGEAAISEFEAPTLPIEAVELSPRLDAAFTHAVRCLVYRNKSKLDHLAMISSISRERMPTISLTTASGNR
jgi:hypothetical protein